MMTTKAIVKKPIETFRELLTKMRPEIVKALPRHMSPDRIARAAVTLLQKTPLLQQCAPVTVLGAFIQSAQLGLEIDNVLGQAYLVPYYNGKKNRHEAQFQIGFKGYRQLVSRAGTIDTFLPNVVYQGDVFEYNMAEARVVRHQRTSETDPIDPEFFYTVVHYKSGNYEWSVMTKREVDHVRDSFSKAYRSAKKRGSLDTPWVEHYDAMGMKTVMRRHAKYLPLSVEAARGVALDEMADAGIPQDLGTLIDTSEVPSNPDQSNEDPIRMPESTEDGGSESSEF